MKPTKQACIDLLCHRQKQDTTMLKQYTQNDANTEERLRTSHIKNKVSGNSRFSCFIGA